MITTSLRTFFTTKQTDVEDGSKTLLYFKLQSLVFLIAVLLITVRLDGFAQDNTSALFQLTLLPYTLLFLFLLRLFFRPAILEKLLVRFVPKKMAQLDKHWNWTTFTLLVTGVFELGTLALVLFENRFFANFGYSLSYPFLIVVFGLILGGTVVLWLNRSRLNLHPDYLFYFVLMAYVLVYLLSLSSFPLNPKRSDMLPLITAANHAFLNGQAPYAIYTLPSGSLPLTYLPGTWLSYLPAVAMGIDVRVLNIGYVVGAVFILYKGVAQAERARILALIAIFLLNPYLQYRHEIYLPPYWCVLTASLIALRKERQLWGIFFFAVSVTMSQFSWVMLPFLLLYLYRSFGVKLAALTLLITALVFAIVVAPFMLWTPDTFFSGVLTHWGDATGVNARTANFSWFTAKLVGAKNLQYVQAIVLIVLFAGGWFRVRTLSDGWRWMIIGLVGFILFNILIWTYFYLSIFMLLLLYLIIHSKQLANLPIESAD